jgi:hypothetical protein
MLSLALMLALAPSLRADESPVVFKEDFESGADRWQPLDAGQWQVKKTDKGQVFSQHEKKSAYKPPHRSPTNVALLKGIAFGELELTAKVRSTHPDYGHRDAVVVFGYQDPAQAGRRPRQPDLHRERCGPQKDFADLDQRHELGRQLAHRPRRP